MAAFLDVCRFTPTAGSTTDWTYSAAVTGYQSPASAGVVNGRLYKYRAESADLSQWEVGQGAYNTGTGVLARTTVLFNSSGGTSKINFTLAPQVAIVALKEDLVSVEEANSFTATQQQQARQNIGAISVPDVIIEDQKSIGTAGGTATSGSFPARTLNVLVRNSNTLAALASNQFTLPAGTYYIQWSAPAFAVSSHQTLIRNITDASIAGIGSVEVSSVTTQTSSSGSCVTTIAGSKVFELQHRVFNTQPANGYGVNAGFSTEVYSRVEITRLS